MRWLSRISWMLGKPDEAERYAAEAIHLLETLPPSAELAMAYGNKAQLLMIAEDHAGAVQWGERTIALAESLGDVKTLAHALNTVGTAQLSAQNEQGRARLERSLQIALEQGWEDHVARAYCNLVTCAMRTRDYPQAVRYLQRGLAYCTEHDLDTWRTYLMAWQAAIKFEQGDWDKAASEAKYVLDQHRFFPATKFWALMTLGWIGVRRGDPVSAAMLDEARNLALASGELQRIAPVAAARAEGAWLYGDQKRSLAEAQEGYELSLMHIETDPWALGELCTWMWRVGGLTQAPRQIAEPFAMQIAGDWRRAAWLWEQLGCPYEQALALIDGDAEAMGEALSIFGQLGAQPAAARVRLLLRQQGITGVPSGARPSTRANMAGLTNRQLEVLHLVIQGCSNLQIAKTLFTSPKTIDHHVSAIFAKLGVHSRAQAISIASRMGLTAVLQEKS
ncbi:MAG TPA: response regulator transcription factor [Ktedonobacteraceae bacterium]|nr:response regulator transcription factor [Ktedonobacteraceae bacterium]